MVKQFELNGGILSAAAPPDTLFLEDSLHPLYRVFTIATGLLSERGIIKICVFMLFLLIGGYFSDDAYCVFLLDT